MFWLQNELTYHIIGTVHSIWNATQNSRIYSNVQKTVAFTENCPTLYNVFQEKRHSKLKIRWESNQ